MQERACADLSSEKLAAEQALQIHPDAKRPILPEGDLWVFGYGSLMWRQGFISTEQCDARLFGYHRALCVSSHVHRGTPEVPGLVLGLDKGGSCRGRLFRVPASEKEEVANYLYGREMPTAVYLAKILPVLSVEGVRHNALTFVVDRQHPQYIHSVTSQELATIVTRAEGISGTSEAYLQATLSQLRSRNLRDSKLEAIAKHLAD